MKVSFLRLQAEERLPKPLSDTSRVFQKEQDEYRRCLIKSYLTDEETAEQEARQYYDKMKSGRVRLGICEAYF